LPRQRRKFLAPGCTHLDHRLRASWNFFAAGCAALTLGTTAVRERKELYEFVASDHRAAADIGIGGSEANRCVIPGNDKA